MDGTVTHYIGVQNDVTERVTAQQSLHTEQARAQGYLTRIEELAFTDPLTGLSNRRRIEEQTETALWDAHAGNTAVAMLFCDLDGFKPVNDRWGHQVGDELLSLTAARLQGRLRRSDLLARLGGDEFLVVLPGLEVATAGDEARRVATQLAAAVANPTSLREQTLSPRISIGVSIYPHDGETFGALLHTADLRLYEHKHGTSNHDAPKTLDGTDQPTGHAPHRHS